MTESNKSKPTARWYVSSFHKKKDDVNVVGVVEKIEYTDESGNKTYKDNLHWYYDPQRVFYVTQPGWRNYKYKKEFEDINLCDKYICRDSELEERIGAALGYFGYRKRPLRQLCASPYLYVADIPTEDLIKQEYVRRQPQTIAPFTRGGLDIETEVRGEKRINVITFIHEHEIFTCALKEYCRIHLGDDKFKAATKEDCLGAIDKYIGKYMKDHNFTLTFEIVDTELDLIKWIFARIHEKKTNFVGVWNLSFDIPKIIERIVSLGADPEEIMCHPSVPKEYRYLDWYEDKSNTKQKAHITDRWHWLTLAGYTQFLDSMCLYARLRKASGKESSYSLDYISNKVLGQGKLHLEGEISNHWYEQTYKFLDYIAYNINDVLVMQLMEFKTEDMIALTALSGNSLMSEFSKQTVQVRNDAYVFAKQHGKVPATSSMNMFNEYDEMMIKVGGTVLPPNKAIGVSIRALEETNGRTLATVLTNDLDVSSFYPSVIEAFNISKESCLATIINVNGHTEQENEILNGGIVQPRVGAMDVGTNFFGLNNYREALDAFNVDLASGKI